MARWAETDDGLPAIIREWRVEFWHAVGFWYVELYFEDQRIGGFERFREIEQMFEWIGNRVKELDAPIRFESLP